MYYLFSVCCVFLCGRNVLCGSITNTTRVNHRDSDDYYANYDYDLPASNQTGNDYLKTDSLILPNPEFLDARYGSSEIDVLPNIDLPSDSYADTDLRDHDFIDNLMYIYYGGSHVKSNGTNGLGSTIILVGSVIGCASHLLTICCALLRTNANVTANRKRNVTRIFLHLIGSMCVANLLFVLGVYATKSYVKCQLIALFLHYLHLLTSFWICLHCYYICKKFSGDYLPQLRYFCLIAYGIPFVLVLFCYAISPHSYETKQFCFVSVQKGMLLNYMLPVSILIITTTMLSLNGIRIINLELSKLELTSSDSLNAFRVDDIDIVEKKCEQVTGDEEILGLREFKNSLKTLCLVQTSYDVVWFIAVLALENAAFSNVMPVLYAISSCFLNWYIFGKSKSFIPALCGLIENTTNDDREETSTEKDSTNLLQSTSRCSSSDNIPLLNNAECFTELRELRHDTISTITT